MNFLAPGAFFLGLLLPVIVALYLLKLRRIEREVPSTYLWRQMVRDVEANAPWQKLRPNLLMILQLLFLLALIFALARPFVWSEGAGGQAAILILDSSASMAATDVRPSRIESAKERARQLVDDLPDQSRVTIIEAGAEARVLVSSSTDRRQAHLALQSIQAGTGGSDLGIAIELASAIAERQPGTEIIVLSDGKVELPERLTVKGSLRYLPFGLEGDNQAISLLTLTTTPAGGATAFAQISNYADAPASRRLTIFAGEELVNVFDVNDIPPGGQKTVITDVRGVPETIDAYLDGADALALDDHAVAVKPDAPPTRVTLVTPGNRFLVTALRLLLNPNSEQDRDQALTPNTQEEDESYLTVVPPEDVVAEAGDTPSPQATAATPEKDQSDRAPTQVIIYDGVIPDEIPSGASLLFIAPPRSTEFFTVSGVMEQPAARVIDAADPLVNQVVLGDVSIFETNRVPLPAWATPVLAGEGAGENTPLLFRGEPGGRRVAVLAFDLRESDLPLQIAFPVMIANLMNWLAPGSGGAAPTEAVPGEAITFTAPGEAQSAEITLPDGTTDQVQADGGRIIFTNTRQIGLYRVRFAAQEGVDEEQETAFSVNLFSPVESNIKPAASLPGVQAAGGEQEAVSQQAMREWWRPLAFLALGLLMGEWLVYQRAALARLRDAILPARAAAAPSSAQPGAGRGWKGKKS